MSILERLRGRLGHQSTEHKLILSEGEPRSSVVIQYAFLSDQRPDLVFSLKPHVANFFQEDPSSDNVFVMDSPLFLGALDLPHFYSWVDKTGSYFSGFTQHCATSGNGKPISQEDLARERETVELLDDIDETTIINDTKLPWQAVREQVFIGKMMLLFDKLTSDSVPFRLAIQPLSKLEIARMLKDPDEVVRDESDDEKPIDTENFEEVIEETRDYYERKIRSQTQIPAFKNRLFIPFLNTVVNEAAKGTRNARIFVPRTYLSYLTDYQMIEESLQEVKSVSCAPPVFIDCGGEYPDVEQVLTAKFMKDPDASLSREEAISLMVIGTLLGAIDPLLFARRYKQRIPEVLAKSTPEELEELLRKVLLPQPTPTDEELGIDPLLPEKTKTFIRSLKRTNPRKVAMDYFTGKTSVPEENDF